MATTLFGWFDLSLGLRYRAKRHGSKEKIFMKTSVKWICSSLLVASALVFMLSCAFPHMDDYASSQMDDGQMLGVPIPVRIVALNEIEAGVMRSGATRSVGRSGANGVFIVNVVDEMHINFDLQVLDAAGRHVGTLTHFMYSIDRTVNVNGENLSVFASTRQIGQYCGMENAVVLEFTNTLGQHQSGVGNTHALGSGVVFMMDSRGSWSVSFDGETRVEVDGDYWSVEAEGGVTGEGGGDGSMRIRGPDGAGVDIDEGGITIVGPDGGNGAHHPTPNTGDKSRPEEHGFLGGIPWIMEPWINSPEIHRFHELQVILEVHQNVTKVLEMSGLMKQSNDFPSRNVRETF